MKLYGGSLHKFTVNIGLYILKFFVLCGSLIFWLKQPSKESIESRIHKSVEIILFSKSDGVKLFKVKVNGNFATFYQILERMIDADRDLINELSSAITNNSKSGAIFWECVPITYETCKQIDFEFVILPAYELGKRIVDFKPFSKKFDENLHEAKEDVITFDNLGRDSRLIVPCPIIDSLPVRISEIADKAAAFQHMTHLASFIRSAPEQQILSLWSKVGRAVMSKLRESPSSKLWLSTSGMGVSWLHIRVDSVPKYYNHLEYTL